MRRHFMGLLAACFGVLLTGSDCSLQIPPPTNATGGASGKLRIVVTDKPFPFELIKEAGITITRVEIRRFEAEAETVPDATDDAVCDAGSVCPAGPPCDEPDDGCAPATTAADGDDEEDADGSWVVVFDGRKDFNLLDLQDGRTDLLADAEVPADTYDQVRLVVTEGMVVLINDREFGLIVPSGEQTGIKLHFTFEVVEGEETPLLLDVDLSRAFQPIPGSAVTEAGDIRGFHFQPSVAMRLINLLQAGSISGTVRSAVDNSPLVGVAATAFLAAEEITSTATQPDGTYTLSGLLAGTYRVEFSAGGFNDVSVEGVVVSLGVTGDPVDVVMSPVTPP